MNAFVVVILLSLGAASAIHLQLGYQKGQRYIYNYQVDVFHAVPGGSVKTLGLRVMCQAFVDMFQKTEMQITLANFKVFQVTGNLNTKKQEPTAIDEKVVEAMQKKLSLPVKVVLKTQDGSIKEVNAHTGDEEWSHNIKRGLVNLLQITPHKPLKLDQFGKQFFTQQEATAVGDCQVAYVINLYQPDPKKNDQVAKVTKVINYEKCRQRPEFSMNTFYGQWCADCQQSMGFAPYHRSLGQIDHTLEGCQKNGFTIKTTRAMEQHVITPFARSGGQVAATARQILQFDKKEDVKGHASSDLTKTITRTCIAENPEKWARANAERQQQIALQAEKGIEEMCKAVKDPANQQAGEKFAAVVQLLRKCNKDTLEKQVDKILARQDQTERKFCLDALSYVGTSEAFQIIKKRIEDKKITKTAELERMFVGLAAAPRPTFVHIDTTWHLCKLTHVWTDIFLARQCLLAFGALVHKINQRPVLQQDTKAVTACEEHVKEMLDELAKEQTTQHHMLTYIKALGNAGMIQAQDRLLIILKDETKPLFIRIQCVWALRRIVIQARGQKSYPCLIAIFANANEHPEVRMAIFLLMLNTDPNFAILQTLVNTVRREITNPLPGPRSNQLLSFVFSHLLALAWHDNVLTKRRSMHARMALRLMPRMDLGMGYSKGMRLSHHSEKFQAGFEMEVNKMDVPEGMLPRNMNARMQFNFLGYKMNAFEFGARIENMDDIIEQVISQVRTRHKRSLWGSVLSWFGEESAPTDEDTEETEKRPSRPPVFSRRRRSSKPYQLFENAFTKRPTSRPISDPPVTKQQRMSAYMKLFGDEVKFVEMGQENVIQMASDIADLLLGKKDRIEYATQGVVITISKGAIVINQVLEKAMMVTNGRRVLPTLAGIPLDMQLRTAAAIKVTTAAKITVEPALMNFWKFQKITANVDIKPRVHVHALARVGFHTPFLHLGLQMKANVRSDHEHKADVIIENGKKYQVNYNLPQAQRDIIHIKANTEGFVEQLTAKFEPMEVPIPMEFNKAHLVQLDRTCIGQDFFGVQMCVEGKQVPDIPTLRLQQVPVFPTIGLAEVRVAMVPVTGNPTLLQWITTVDKTTEQEDQFSGKIMQMASKEVKRQILYKGTYTRGDKWELRIDTTVVPEGCENCMMKITVNKNEGLKVQFGGQTQYQITTLPQIQSEGKCLRIQADWTELPAKWKTFFYNWEPMIWHFVQQFAWVRRREQRAKQVVFEFKLTSPMTADLKIEALDVVAARTDLALPLRIDRFPLTMQEIRNQFYAQCIVEDQTIKVFDQLQYQHNIRGGCPYILVQEHRKDKQNRIKLTVKIDEKVQKTMMAVIQQTQQQAKETVQINPDLTILIDGQKQECRQKACQSKQGGATVQMIQTPDGQIQIHMQTKMGLHAIIQSQRIEVYASPLLRGRVRGLCGDADGEQWNEYRDRQDQLQQLQQFIHAWQEKC